MSTKQNKKCHKVEAEAEDQVPASGNSKSCGLTKKSASTQQSQRRMVTLKGAQSSGGRNKVTYTLLSNLSIFKTSALNMN